MKNLTLILILLVAVSLMGCKKQEQVKPVIDMKVTIVKYVIEGSSFDLIAINGVGKSVPMNNLASVITLQYTLSTDIEPRLQVSANGNQDIKAKIIINGIVKDSRELYLQNGKTILLK